MEINTVCWPVREQARCPVSEDIWCLIVCYKNSLYEGKIKRFSSDAELRNGPPSFVRRSAPRNAVPVCRVSFSRFSAPCGFI